jgi:hypothetical protein
VNRSLRLSSWLLLSAVLLAACEPAHGAETFLALSRIPNIACIDGALRATPGVISVSYGVDKSQSEDILPHHAIVNAENYHWQYNRPVGAILQVTQEGTNISIQNGLVTWFSQPPSTMDTLIPLMQRINMAIERRCGIPIASHGRYTRYP